MLDDERAPEHLSVFLEALDHEKMTIKFRVDVCNTRPEIVASKRERRSSRHQPLLNHEHCRGGLLAIQRIVESRSRILGVVSAWGCAGGGDL